MLPVRLPQPGEREAAATLSALVYDTVANPLGIRAIPEGGLLPGAGPIRRYEWFRSTTL